MEAVAIHLGAANAAAVRQEGLLQRHNRCIPAGQLCPGHDPAANKGKRSRRSSHEPAPRPPWADSGSGSAGWTAQSSILRRRRILRVAFRPQGDWLSNFMARHIDTLAPPPMPRLWPFRSRRRFTTSRRGHRRRLQNLCRRGTRTTVPAGIEKSAQVPTCPRVCRGSKSLRAVKNVKYSRWFWWRPSSLSQPLWLRTSTKRNRPSLPLRSRPGSRTWTLVSGARSKAASGALGRSPLRAGQGR